MFRPDCWAAAFTELCGKDTRDIEEGAAAFNAFVSASARIKNPSGRNSRVLRYEALLRNAVREAGLDSGGKGGGRGVELALRLLVLLMKKDYFKYRFILLDEIEKAAGRARGSFRVTLESAAPIDGEFEDAVKAALLRRMGAREIILKKRIVPELIAGYRVYTGAELLDTSLRGSLRKMAAGLNACPPLL